MVKTKYVMSQGLAFAENKDMEMLSKKASEGWVLKKFAIAGYRLEKKQPEKVQFNIDYRLLKREEEEEYFELFEMAGWQHICSNHDMHIFKGKPGTQPIYSDVESTVDKVDRLSRPIYTLAKFLFPLTIILFMMMFFSSGIIQHVGNIGFLIAIVFTVPTAMMLIALTSRKMTKSG